MQNDPKAPYSKATVPSKSDFLEQTRLAREDRARRQTQDAAAIIIQAAFRGFRQQQKFLDLVRQDFDAAINFDENDADYRAQLKPAVEIYPCIRRFLTFCCRFPRISKRYDCLCKYILLSLNQESLKLNYMSLVLRKDLAAGWIEHIKCILKKSVTYFNTLKPDNANDLRSINTLLTILVSFTSTSGWKILSGKAADILLPAMNQLCNNIMISLINDGFYSSMGKLLVEGTVRSKPCFKMATHTAICTLVMRPLVYSNYAESNTREFLLHILSVPAFILHTQRIASEAFAQFVSQRTFSNILQFLSNEEHLQAVAVTLEGNRTLCLLANVVQLGLEEMEGVVNNVNVFTTVISKLLDMCGQFMTGKKSNKSHWHPVLGWTSQPYDYNECVLSVLQQLEYLWSPKTLRLLFADLMEFADGFTAEAPSVEEQKPSTEKKNKSIGLVRKKKVEKKVLAVKIDSSVILSSCSACRMYQTAINVLIQIQGDLLAGLAYNPDLLRCLWALLKNLGLKVLLDSLSTSNSLQLPVYTVLTLFCDAASHLVMILDDVELYEHQKPFTLEDLVNLSDLLNNFIFKIIWQDFIDWRVAESNPLFMATYSLMQLLYERDGRRPYAPPNHWLIKDIRTSQFISSIDKGNKTVQFLLHKMPHIVPHKDRVILFRKWVLREKESLGITESDSVHLTPNITFITVHRSRMLEDGYRQLAGLPVLSLKGIIRVKFINEQGLDEVGIDQDGVFKEFLEETIKRVFDPGLNLFKVTTEQKLYPSPTSSLTENHLALFEFVGRMLGKAVYEGLVVDVPFAPFFLTQILDNTKNSMYSYLDELPSMDPLLYKNLTYVKHYEGEVSELDLTFSYDEDFLGTLKNFELKPGGRAICVTNSNKISYVHLMARFKMHTQIKEQTAAFIRGFKSIINYDWLQMFSTPEVQKLISGDTVDIDLLDLRKHTQYYGGFHNGHRVIVWLWDILEKDFSEKERALFLKFVTSCSKPPLLGFSQLEPPFSIRCVEVSDDQDTGDTIGSVLKGFFSIRRNEPAGRLPTSSTCFNLLKLPNYSKKSTLRDKLRYSIHSNTGFELS